MNGAARTGSVFTSRTCCDVIVPRWTSGSVQLGSSADACASSESACWYARPAAFGSVRDRESACRLNASARWTRIQAWGLEARCRCSRRRTSAPRRFRRNTADFWASESPSARYWLAGCSKLVRWNSAPLAASTRRTVTRTRSFSCSTVPSTRVPTLSARPMLSRGMLVPRYGATPFREMTSSSPTWPSWLMSPSVSPSASARSESPVPAVWK